MSIPKSILDLHDEIIQFGSDIQAISSQRIDTEHHVEESIYIVFYKVCAYGIRLHRAVRTLCQYGWTDITPLLLRSLVECSANCLAIANSRLPEYMAFKYLYYPYIELIKDENFPTEVRDKAKLDLEVGVNKLKVPKAKDLVTEFIGAKKLPRYWFCPEEANITSIIEKYGGSEMKFAYKSLSTSTHGYHFGIGLFKDDSDVVAINPTDNPERTKSALLFSCRHLLELNYIRNQYEGLGFQSKYDELLGKIISFKPKG
jgi:hypothetical protein